MAETYSGGAVSRRAGKIRICSLTVTSYRRVNLLPGHPREEAAIDKATKEIGREEGVGLQ